ncbi:hypothetical protein HPO96_12285 [Kribbella sandramycini]|uniref:Uncharacterized protein n=1 Tax=Kribbella sandramycini TaxID=60450 RepID=A0A7Y4KYI6_9ACTN|nr:hypothetical protein [Kribbella sandramycini]MBB6569133.1 hypothetical protein [Kribbella sandramycini]NOL41025.1 hypothetical protein [Kribbella sandramycini]
MLVAVGAAAFLGGPVFVSDHPSGLRAVAEVAVDDELREVNRCLAKFDVVMYRGADGRYRIHGDINRIQDIVFSPCRAAFPPGARKDLDTFFATEVDFRIARCLRARGVDAVIDLKEGPGIEINGKPPAKQVLDDCFAEVYDWYRIPPEQRPAEDLPEPLPRSIGVGEKPAN